MLCVMYIFCGIPHRSLEGDFLEHPFTLFISRSSYLIIDFIMRVPALP